MKNQMRIAKDWNVIDDYCNVASLIDSLEDRSLVLVVLQHTLIKLKGCICSCRTKMNTHTSPRKVFGSTFTQSLVTRLCAVACVRFHLVNRCTVSNKIVLSKKGRRWRRGTFCEFSAVSRTRSSSRWKGFAFGTSGGGASLAALCELSLDLRCWRGIAVGFEWERILANGMLPPDRVRRWPSFGAAGIT